MELWCFLLCLMLVCILIHSILLAAKARKLPPGPFPFPIVGNLLQLGKMPHKSLTMLAKFHGPIMSLKLGQVTTIVISSAPMAKEILQKHDLHFSNRAVPDAITAHNHHKFSVAWLPPSNQWRNLRKISNTHVFAAQKLDANQHLRRKKIDELLAYVKQRSEEGVAVDIGEAAFMTSLNLMSNTMFSTDLVSPNSDGAREFWDLISDTAKQLGKPNLADYFPVVRSIDLQGIRRKHTTSFGKFLGIFDKIIDERLQSRQTHNSAPGSDVLDTLLSINQNNEIDRNQILHLITSHVALTKESIFKAYI
ncbi:Cytochrome P450 [Dillenia turbinata]|uniref:Cytochrome P450 n=1 Tax=Dillenia turbinata TaxID=194707 RepID=A0AAN8ZII5_9MAGN